MAHLGTESLEERVVGVGSGAVGVSGGIGWHAGNEAIIRPHCVSQNTANILRKIPSHRAGATRMMPMGVSCLHNLCAELRRRPAIHDPHHLVGSALKLIWDAFDRDRVTELPN